jgi:hypothetical protein
MPVEIDMDAYASAIAADQAKLFAAGLPIVYEDQALGNRTVREYEDGRREFVAWDEVTGEILVEGAAPARSVT